MPARQRRQANAGQVRQVKCATGQCRPSAIVRQVKGPTDLGAAKAGQPNPPVRRLLDR